MSVLARVSLPLLLLAAGSSQAQVLCDIPKNGGGKSSGAFYVMKSSREICPKLMQINEPVHAVLECVQGHWNATCEAWPMVYPTQPGDGEQLQYTFSVTQGGITTVYPESSNAALSLTCPPLQTTFVQVTVRNGSASDGASVGFRCGDDPE